jgi:hypothetical protein
MRLSGGRYARQLVRKEGGCAAGSVIGDRSGSAVFLVREMVVKVRKMLEERVRADGLLYDLAT